VMNGLVMNMEALKVHIAVSWGYGAAPLVQGVDRLWRTDGLLAIL
jgi:hypothetical protein